MSGYTGVINIPVNTRVDNVDGGARLYSSLGDYVFKEIKLANSQKTLIYHTKRQVLICLFIN